MTPNGHYEFNRMPFGFANAPCCYQRNINKALGVLKDTIVRVYLDDVIIPCEYRRRICLFGKSFKSFI